MSWAATTASSAERRRDAQEAVHGGVDRCFWPSVWVQHFGFGVPAAAQSQNLSQTEPVSQPGRRTDRQTDRQRGVPAQVWRANFYLLQKQSWLFRGEPVSSLPMTCMGPLSAEAEGSRVSGVQCGRVLGGGGGGGGSSGLGFRGLWEYGLRA